jgi:hypothetical protein
MTGIATIGTVDMVGVFAAGNGTVMATGTGADHVVVIYLRYRQPLGNRVAVITGIR